MSKGRSPWQDGRRAWERLTGWHRDAPSAHPDDGDQALKALADVGLLRHLLDQAELVAVRTARRHRKSWAEIATMLGVTRQSAWERWRDLDEEPMGGGSSDRALPDAAAELVERVTVKESAEVSLQAARERRRGSSTVVPNVIGRSWEDARTALRERGLVAVGPDPDGPPLVAGQPQATVTDQSPESGAKVPAGSAVTLWVERGGGSAGVREPRRPKPAPKSARAMRDEESNEAVG
jgi:hypothetical protein